VNFELLYCVFSSFYLFFPLSGLVPLIQPSLLFIFNLVAGRQIQHNVNHQLFLAQYTLPNQSFDKRAYSHSSQINTASQHHFVYPLAWPGRNRKNNFTIII